MEIDIIIDRKTFERHGNIIFKHGEKEVMHIRGDEAFNECGFSSDNHTMIRDDKVAILTKIQYDIMKNLLDGKNEIRLRIYQDGKVNGKLIEY